MILDSMTNLSYIILFHLQEDSHLVDGNNDIHRIHHLDMVLKMVLGALHHPDNGDLTVRGMAATLPMALSHLDQCMVPLQCKVSQECDRHIDQT